MLNLVLALDTIMFCGVSREDRKDIADLREGRRIPSGVSREDRKVR